MAFLSWHERFFLDHPEVDAQHKMLFEIVNHFADVIRMGMDDELGRIMDDLLVCVTEHFEYEERLMNQISFPEVADHTRTHEELIGQLRQMQTRMRTGGHVSSKSVARFLADWLSNHILREDLAYKGYLKK